MYIVEYLFYALVCFLYVFFGEVAVEMFCLFFIGFVLLWNFEKFFYFLDTNCEFFLNPFSQGVVRLVVFITMSGDGWKCVLLKKKITVLQRVKETKSEDRT